jgi:hypothetical protein
MTEPATKIINCIFSKLPEDRYEEKSLPVISITNPIIAQAARPLRIIIGKYLKKLTITSRISS